MTPHSANPTAIAQGSTPLTDPRAWLGSLGFHLLLLALFAWAGTSGLTRPRGEPSWGRTPLRAEVEPAIDNRIAALDSAPGQGDDPTLIADSESRSSPTSATSSGVGEGAGEGVGQDGGIFAGGGGDGGGGGGTTFFETPETARSIVYVIDRSGSMGERGGLRRAKAELLASLARLADGARFAVILYNHDPLPFEPIAPKAGPGWLDATPANRARLAAWLEPVDAQGGTRPRPVLEAALALRPEAVYYVTDGQELSATDVEALIVAARAAAARIHTIDLGATQIQGPAAPLRRLADATGGGYRQVGLAGSANP